jgi:hypothetical protein
MGKIVPLEFTIESQRKHLKAIADCAGVTIRWDPTCKVPTASRDGVITTSPPDFNNLLGWLRQNHHEIGHLFPENRWHYDFFDLKPTSREVMVANIIVDYLADKSRWGHYSGRDHLMEKGLAELLKDFPLREPRDPYDALLQALLYHDVELRKKWKDTPHLQMVDYPLPTSCQILLDQVIGLSLETKMGVLSTPAELMTLVKEILTLLPPDKSEGESEGKDKGKSEGEGEDKDKGKDKGEGEDKDKGKDKGEGEDKDKGKDEGEDTTTGAGGSDGNPAIDAIYKHLDRGVEKKSVGRGTYLPVNNELKTIPAGWVDSTIEKLVIRCTVGKQIRKHLLSLVPRRYSTGKTSGVINSKAIHTLFTKEKPKIFKQKDQMKVALSSAITLLVDCSGSMAGSKFYTAAAGAIAMGQVLSALRIPYEVLGFTELFGINSIYPLKAFSEKAVAGEKMNSRFNGILKSNNGDGEALLFAAERLLQRPERNKVMIVLSDGTPAVSRIEGRTDQMAYDYLKEVAKRIEEQTPITLIGIGIQSSAVRDFYRNNQVVDDIEELEGAILLAMKKNILIGE